MKRDLESCADREIDRHKITKEKKFLCNSPNSFCKYLRNTIFYKNKFRKICGYVSDVKENI